MAGDTRESGGPIGGGRGRARAGGPRGGIERGVASEHVKECVRAGVSAPERHHHRCYLNVFVGGRRGGGVINVQVEESHTERALTNSFAGARYGFTSREEVARARETEEGRGGRERARDGAGRKRACECERARDRNVINAGPRDRRQTKIINIYRPRFARVCPIETQYSLRRPSLMQTHRVRATIAKFRPYANRANSIMLITLNSPEQLFAFLHFFFFLFLFHKAAI